MDPIARNNPAPGGAYGIAEFVRLIARLHFMHNNANDPTVFGNSMLPRSLHAIRFTIAFARMASAQMVPLALAMQCIVWIAMRDTSCPAPIVSLVWLGDSSLAFTNAVLVTWVT